MATPFTIAQFRIDFPEFVDTTKYPDAMVTFWSNLAYNLLNDERWGDIKYQGICLFTAHQIALQAMDIQDVTGGGDPGRSSAIISSASAGGVSMSMDTSASIENDAGHWNETRYGRQYIRLAKMFGIGGLQLFDYMAGDTATYDYF